MPKKVVVDVVGSGVPVILVFNTPPTVNVFAAAAAAAPCAACWAASSSVTRSLLLLSTVISLPPTFIFLPPDLQAKSSSPQALLRISREFLTAKPVSGIVIKSSRMPVIRTALFIFFFGLKSEGGVVTTSDIGGGGGGMTRLSDATGGIGGSGMGSGGGDVG